MLKRSHVRQFLAVVDSGSFTQAAARVRITQPTLSVGIAEMEKLVGAKLFIRDRKHVRITEAGAQLLPIARQLEQGFRAAEGLSAQADNQWPQVRLGMLQSLSGPMAQAVVAAISPEFELEIIEGSNHELRSALASGRIDLALTLIKPDESAHTARTMASEPYVMLVPEGHALADADILPPTAFAAEIMIARRSCEILQDTSRFFTRNGVRPRFALKSDNDDLCLRMVAAGLGITTAPLSMARAGTVPVQIEGYDFARTLGAIWTPQASDTPELQQSIARICDLMAAVL